ncbi:hypothetical protein BDV95DRAFT_593153 [Massariosphaeria phaeospora]|uniref:Uncharacterized protein n=1 Tax=Massariosphaeria phaeospora TaxID=100035 RepID=A0A7C8IDX2_9PLEO|nr:hypothetical protein BDV95DRAFT_593153 [Massariosphaeria phaeospora]
MSDQSTGTDYPITGHSPAPEGPQSTELRRQQPATTNASPTRHARTLSNSGSVARLRARDTTTANTSAKQHTHRTPGPSSPNPEKHSLWQHLMESLDAALDSVLHIVVTWIILFVLFTGIGSFLWYFHRACLKMMLYFLVVVAGHVFFSLLHWRYYPDRHEGNTDEALMFTVLGYEVLVRKDKDDETHLGMKLLQCVYGIGALTVDWIRGSRSRRPDAETIGKNG